MVIDKNIKWLHKIRKEELMLISKNINIKSETILELGCGDGLQSLMLKKQTRFLVSADINDCRLSDRVKKELNFLICNAEYLPFKNDSFNIIFSSNLIEHIYNKEKAFSEMKRVLKPGGFMVHSVPLSTWKILHIVFYYGDLIKKILTKPPSIRIKKLGFKKNNKNPKIEKKSIVNYTKLLFPEVHGTSKNNIQEFIRFRKTDWIRLFEQNNLKIEKIIKLPLYGPYYSCFSDILLKAGNLFNLHSSVAFVFKVTK